MTDAANAASRMAEGPPLPKATRAYLAHTSLTPLWVAARDRLERNGLSLGAGVLWAALDEAGHDRLTGLAPTGLRRHPDRGTGVRLDALDAALRASAAARGLVSVLTELAGPLVDRRAVRADRAADTAQLWAALEQGVVAAGLGSASWTPAWLTELRRGGLLTRAGAQAVTVVVQTSAALAALAAAGTLPARADTAGTNPDPWCELAELASRCTGSAHGLDDGTTTAAVVQRALAYAFELPIPSSAAGKRGLWQRAGVSPDSVSATVLAFELRPPGTGPWAAMMRSRAELGLVSHVSMHEWQTAASAERWAPAGSVVHACENPQVLQAAARAGVPVPLLCLSGNPVTVAYAVLDALTADGVTVAYHGDFDGPGLEIAARLFTRGATPWRMTAADYITAAACERGAALLPLSGTLPRTAWDPELGRVMAATGVAVHEEAMLEVLLGDLAS